MKMDIFYCVSVEFTFLKIAKTGSDSFHGKYFEPKYPFLTLYRQCPKEVRESQDIEITSGISLAIIILQ